MNAPEPVVHAQAGSTAIPLAFITPSPTNPRKHFDQATLDELTESVRKHGVIQPVLVRSGTSPKDKRILWELVAGERRYRAAKAAGLQDIPAIVRSLTDAEALELQVIENLQREDLHPLEEAEGYELLMKQHHHTAEDLAHKVGKSKAYVYARLKLTALTPKGREAFYAGKLNPSTALLVARIPVAKLQDEALKEITATYGDGEPRFGVRGAAQFLQQKYMLRLGDAPFPTGDEKLVPRAGTCAACPKRTGNQPELFGDVKGADVCTDPECFAAKKDANIVRIRAAAEAKGQRVITGKDAKKIIPFSTVDHQSGFTELDAKNFNDPKARTNRALIGKELPANIILVEHPESGKMIEVVPTKDVAAVLKAKIPSLSRSRSNGSGNDEQKKREAKARLETQVNTAIFEAIATKHSGNLTPPDAALIAGEFFELTDHEAKKRILRTWEPEAFEQMKDKLWELEKRFARRTAEMSPQELVKLMVQLALVSEVHVSSYSGGKSIKLLAAADRLKIDHAAIRRTHVDAAKAKEKKPAPKFAKTKAGARARTKAKAKE